MGVVLPFLLALALWPPPASAADAPAGAVDPLSCTSAEPGQPPRLHMVTTSPGGQLFSAFGHSALWLSGGGLARPVVLDWGNFDSSQGEPVADFLSGEMRYTLEALTYEELLARARRQGRTAVAQRLDLPPEQALALGREVLAAARAADRGFRYDWLRDNCATRIRDALDRATGGAVRAQVRAGGGHSARHEVLRHLGAPGRGPGGWGWWLGWHLLANGEVDRPLTEAESLFLPDRLMQGLRAVVLPWPDGRTRPLVGAECTLVEGSHPWAPAAPPGRALPLFGAGLAWALGVAALGIVGPRGRGLAAASLAALAFLCGGLGLLAVALAGTSGVEGAGPTHLWWLASPLGLLLLPAALGLWRGRVHPWHVGLALLLALLAAVGTTASALGLLPQVLWPTPALLLPPLLAAPLALWRTRRPPPGS